MFHPCDYFESFDGLRIRWGYRAPSPGGPRGSIILLNGRTEYLEKYAETADDLHRRGWAVYSMDWRGQGLSGRLSPNRLKGHVGRFRDYLEDLARFVDLARSHGAAPPFVLLAHSMGGHIGLRFLRERRHPFACAVLTSPMIDIELPAVPRRLLRGFVRVALQLGGAKAFVPGGRGFARRDGIFEDNPLTSDPERFRRRLSDLAANPRLAVGGVTYGWLNAALDSIERVRAPAFARGLDIPVLLARATEERIVSCEAQARFCRRTPDCRLVDVPGARHELLMEIDRHRQVFWQAFDAFTALRAD
ncbi:MAG: alpha/beta hydrolase [Desulfobacterales bacterium]|nr:alpha/beta hydrolase [Desulfobacterales bacterium]